LRYSQIYFEKNANKIANISISIHYKTINLNIMDIIRNIKNIRLEKGVNQEVIANELGFDIANWSRIENGKQELKVGQLEKIAKVLQVEVIDLFTYPKKYVDKDEVGSAERISITFEVSPDKRDILLNLVTNK